jgi:hypothetical protein
MVIFFMAEGWPSQGTGGGAQISFVIFQTSLSRPAELLALPQKMMGGE